SDERAGGAYQHPIGGAMGIVVCVFALAAAATYDVRAVSLSPPKLAVHAVLPGGSPALETALSRPGDIREINDGGWGALVTEMSAKDSGGRPVALTRSGPAGWTME